MDPSGYWCGMYIRGCRKKAGCTILYPLKFRDRRQREDVKRSVEIYVFIIDFCLFQPFVGFDCREVTIGD